MEVGANPRTTANTSNLEQLIHLISFLEVRVLYVTLRRHATDGIVGFSCSSRWYVVLILLGGA